MSDLASTAVPTASGNASVGTTERTGDETIVKNGDAVTFDDLDLSGDMGKSKREKKEDKKHLIAEAKPDLKTEDKSSRDDAKPESKEKESKSKEAGKEKDKAALEAKAKDELRKLKYKSGDKDFDIDETAIFRHKVNGEEVDVPLKELLSNYSGKTDWTKKYSEFANEKQTYKQERQQIESRIKSIMESQDPEERFYKMAEMSGKSPVEVRRKFLEENLNLLEKYHSMSEDERKADELTFENKYLKHKTDTIDQERRLAEETRALQDRVTKVSKQYGIQTDEMGSYYNKIVEAINNGQLPKETQVTPEYVAEIVMKDKYWDAAAAKIKSLGLNWTPEAQTKEIREITNLAFTTGLDPAEIPDVIDSLWGSKMAKKVIKEKAQEREEFMTGKKQDPAVRKPETDIWDFSQYF